jgi:energy-coupling factor transport system permease protein
VSETATHNTRNARNGRWFAVRQWRTIDLVTAALIGVTFGVAYWGWSLAWTPLSTQARFAGPAVGLLGGPWLIAGVVAALVVRRAGAALFAELLAAAVEALIGNEWGWTTLVSGTLQGIGVEIVVAVFLYRRFGWLVAMLGGALAAFLESVYEWHQYYAQTTDHFKFEYALYFMLSGAVVAGLGGWALTRALAATGAIDALPAGQEAARSQAV